jgi:hypothetical protein
MHQGFSGDPIILSIQLNLFANRHPFLIISGNWTGSEIRELHSVGKFYGGWHPEVLLDRHLPGCPLAHLFRHRYAM